jgi:hypothetical protein
MPEIANHIPAPMDNDVAEGLMDNDVAEGLSPRTGFNVAAPMPIPSILSRSWVARATTTPAKPHPKLFTERYGVDILSRQCRASGWGVTNARRAGLIYV